MPLILPACTQNSAECTNTSHCVYIYHLRSKMSGKLFSFLPRVWLNCRCARYLRHSITQTQSRRAFFCLLMPNYVIHAEGQHAQQRTQCKRSVCCNHSGCTKYSNVVASVMRKSFTQTALMLQVFGWPFVASHEYRGRAAHTTHPRSKVANNSTHYLIKPYAFCS
jgi:hypothetical protein